MFRIFGIKEKRPQKAVVHPELGELKFDTMEWYPVSKVKVALWNRIYDVSLSFFAESEEEEPAPKQEAAYQAFKSVVSVQRADIEKMIMEDTGEENLERAGSRFIPYAVQISRQGECALVFGDTEQCKECDFSHETGFALFLIPTRLLYPAEECLDFMLGHRDLWTLEALYGQKDTEGGNDL